MSSFECRSDRAYWESKIKYVLNHNDEIFIEGDIVNISAVGLCFNTAVELREGQEVIFKDILLNDRETATVVWCEKTDDNCYKIGLQFKQF